MRFRRRDVLDWGKFLRDKLGDLAHRRRFDDDSQVMPTRHQVAGANFRKAVDTRRDLIEPDLSLRRDADLNERHYPFFAEPVPVDDRSVAANDALALQLGD